jgi:hypothetical protein
VPPIPASNLVLGKRRAYSRDDGTASWEALEAIFGGLDGGDGDGDSGVGEPQPTQATRDEKKPPTVPSKPRRGALVRASLMTPFCWDDATLSAHSGASSVAQPPMSRIAVPQALKAARASSPLVYRS